MSQRPAPEGEPFAPRWTWRALRKDWRRNRRHSGGNSLPMLIPLGLSLFCFTKTFLTLREVQPAVVGQVGAASAHAPALNLGLEASMWMVAAAVLLGIAGALSDASWTPRVRLKKGALRDLVKEALVREERLHTPHVEDAVAGSERAGRKAPGIDPRAHPKMGRAPSTADLAAALAEPRKPSPLAPRRPSLTADEAKGARALGALFP